MNKNLLKLLEESEGRRSKVYADHKGILTIAIGRNLESKGLSEDEIDYLFANDVKECIEDLERVIPRWKDLSEDRQNALVSMRFMLGLNGLLGFKKVIAALHRKDYTRAADEIFNSKARREDPSDRWINLSEMMRAG